MNCVNWNDNLRIGIDIIDNQHKKLLDITNRLCKAMDKGDDQGVIMSILDDLSEYAHVHFNTEEEFFRKFGYEHTDEHISQHQFFTEKVLFLKGELSKGHGSVPADTLAFLMDWIVDHISKSDHDYVQCFKEHGLK